MSEASAAAETRKYGKSAGLLTLALGSAGLLAYAFFALASHSLSREDYGEIVVLWSVVFVLASTLFRPIEQLLSRTLAEREQIGDDTGHVWRVAATIQAGVTLAAVLVLLLLHGPITDNLLEGGEVLFWVLVGALIGFGGSYFARGFLAGRRQFGLYATLLVFEGSARLLFALAVALGIAEGIDVVALGIAAAPIASMAVMPFAISRRRSPASLAGTGEQSLAAGTEPEFTLSRGGAFAAAVLIIMLSEQIMVSSGALFVRAAEGAAAAGFIFNVLMVARAPLVLFQAIAASLLPHLTRLRARGDATGADAFRMSVNTTLLTIVGVRGRDHARGARDRPRRDAARVRRQVHLRPGRAGDRRRRDGLLPLGRGAQPGGPGSGPGAAGRALLAHLCRRVRGLEPDRAAGPLPDGRGRVHRRRGAALGAALPPLRAAAPRRAGLGRARLTARDRSQPRGRGRDRLKPASHQPLVPTPHARTREPVGKARGVAAGS